MLLVNVTTWDRSVCVCGWRNKNGHCAWGSGLSLLSTLSQHHDQLSEIDTDEEGPRSESAWYLHPLCLDFRFSYKTFRGPLGYSQVLFSPEEVWAEQGGRRDQKDTPSLAASPPLCLHLQAAWAHAYIRYRPISTRNRSYVTPPTDTDRHSHSHRQRKTQRKTQRQT